MRWYRGDCHVHSRRSHGGELTPQEPAAAARDAGLDFVAVTEHNTADTHAEWAAQAGDDLLVIPGQEATTTTGHWLALGLRPGQVVDWRYGVRDNEIDEQVRQVHEQGGLCVAAHPHAPYPSGVFMFALDGFDLIEVWNGQWATAGGRAEDIGATLTTGGRGALAEVRVHGVPSGSVRFLTDRGRVHQAELPGSGEGTVSWETTAEESAFVRVEVRHPGGHMAALTNPIVLS